MSAEFYAFLLVITAHYTHGESAAMSEELRNSPSHLLVSTDIATKIPFLLLHGHIIAYTIKRTAG